jgi:hypothetical protein
MSSPLIGCPAPQARAPGAATVPGRFPPSPIPPDGRREELPVVAAPILLSAAEARQLVGIVEEGGARPEDVPSEIGRALLGKGLIEACGGRDLWTATDAGWTAYPAALRQVGEVFCRRRRTWRWRPAPRRLLGFLGR